MPSHVVIVGGGLTAATTADRLHDPAVDPASLA